MVRALPRRFACAFGAQPYIVGTPSKCCATRACSRMAMRLPHAKLSEVVVDESSVDRLVDVARSPSSPGELRSDAVVGSAEHLRSVFDRAGPAIDRALGRWLERTAVPVFADRAEPAAEASQSELRAMRALVRAAATAYARHLRDDGVRPERMVVLVKQATGYPLSQGFAVQELT